MMIDAKSGLISGLNPRRNEAQRLATRQSVASGSALTGSYLAMNAAATLMAGFGLLQNSPAVIIGAMLITMLFGPMLWLRGLSIKEYLAARDPVSGTVYYVMLGLCAIMPLLMSRI